MDEHALDHFNKDGGSVEMIGAEHSPGMEVTTGSLAQGLSMASGVAWARLRKRSPAKSGSICLTANSRKAKPGNVSQQ